MKVKPVPAPPDSMDGLRGVCSALPLVPQPENDCCGRLVDRAGVTNRDAARDWLPFLAAIGAVNDTDRGYARQREWPGREAMAASFREGVYLARETLDQLDADPQGVDAVFEGVRDRVPRWERNRTTDWEDAWRDRTHRVLDWAVVLGLAAREEGGYVPD